MIRYYRAVTVYGWKKDEPGQVYKEEMLLWQREADPIALAARRNGRIRGCDCFRIQEREAFTEMIESSQRKTRANIPKTEIREETDFAKARKEMRQAWVEARGTGKKSYGLFGELKR